MAARDYSRMSIEQVEALAEAGDPHAQEAIRQAFTPVVAQVDELIRSAHRQIASVSKPPPELEPITPPPVYTFQDDAIRVHIPHVSSAERWQRIGVIVAVASLLVTLGALIWG